MSWRREMITLGECVGGTWLAGMSRSGRGYLLTNGMGFLQDIVTVTGRSADEVSRELAGFGHDPRASPRVTVTVWPHRDPVTAFYYMLTLPQVRASLERWSSAAVEFCHGVVPGVPVLTPAAAYAAHVGQVGRAVAGLVFARDRGSLAEVCIPDRACVGFSPAYTLPETAYLVGER